MRLKPVQHQLPLSRFCHHVAIDRERRAVGACNPHHLARGWNPSRSRQTVVRRVDCIARFLRGKVCNVEIDPWLRLRLRLARVFVIAHQKVARSENVESLLVKDAVGSRPATNLQGKGTKRRSRRKILAARMGLEHERRSQHQHSCNPEAK